MRGEVLDFAAGFRVVDDSYNSNPRSLINMVNTITEGSGRSRRRIVVAGEMLELGPDEGASSRGRPRDGASRRRCSLGVRGLAAEMVAGANEEGLTATRFFETSEEAGRALVQELREGDLVLIKGSRGVATDRIVKAIRERFPLAGTDED